MEKLPSSSNPTIWVSPSLHRMDLREEVGDTTNIHLYAARGEYESFQIGVKPPQGHLTNVNVHISDLKGKNNQVISNSYITCYREHYVHVTHPSPVERGSTNPSLGLGWYADALIPFVDPDTKKDLVGAELDAVPFDLDAREKQLVWVDVFVPRTAQAGEYSGQFTVTSDQGNSTGEITLKVWSFELPLKPFLQSSFLLWEENTKSAFRELLQHKVMPVGNIKLEDERELIDNWGLNSIRLPFWSGADYQNCTMRPAPSVNDIKTVAAQHQPDLSLYIYSADEIDRCQNLDEPMKQWARNIKQAGVAHLVVMTPVPDLYDNNFFGGGPAVDIWVVSPAMYDKAHTKVAEVLQKGGKIWFYTALVPDNYSPVWQIDFEPINFRIPQGFINQSLGLTGALYWRVDSWTSDPWNNVQTYVQGENHYPGEGMLVYPGKQVGVDGIVPSMRLKWVRDGVEDYEYIEILKNLGYEDWALEISKSVGSDWKNWTKSPQELESVRQTLGNEIERIILSR